MTFALAPVLAQILTVAVGDRAELRLVAQQEQVHYEAENGAYAAAVLETRNSSLRAEYAPRLILTPLEGPSPAWNIFHHAGAGIELTRRTRSTTFSASQTATFDQANTRTEALSGASGPTRGGSTPPAGGSSTGGGQTPVNAEPIVSDATTTTGSTRTELSVVDRLSRTEALTGTLAYALSSGFGESRLPFPLNQGPEARGVYALRLSRRDELSTELSSRYTWNALGDRVFLAGAGESWQHRFGKNAVLAVGLSATYVYSDPHDEPPADALLWGAGTTAGLMYSYLTRFAGGRLSMHVGAGYAPAVDQATLRVDARVSMLAGIGWQRRRLRLFATGSGVVSAEPEDPGALNTVAAELGAVYDMGAGFRFETGARGAWQSFDGAEIVPPSGALYLALAWGATVIGRRSPVAQGSLR